MTGTSDGTAPGARLGWGWDVALSFAGAQRPYVEQVAGALKARGVRCFYDADEQIELWGKYLAEELPAIYGEQAAAVVVFVSAEYAARDWTRPERRAALARAVRERREYVLPARFDDTPLPGLLSDMVWVDLRIRTPQQFAAMIIDKLAALGITEPPGDGNDSRKTTRKNPEPVRIGHLRPARILTDALRAAWQIRSPFEKAQALTDIVRAAAATDPDRAGRLADDAERIAQSITYAESDARADVGLGSKATILADIAGAVTAADPDRAERIAQSITGQPDQKAFALARIARAVTAADPDRAERIAQSIPDGYGKAEALTDIAAAVAATDPDRAGRLIADAERIAQPIPDAYGKAHALTDIAAAVAATDPDRAGRLADDAEEAAHSIPGTPDKAEALARVAAAVAATGPDRAGRLADDAERIAQWAHDKHEKASALARIAAAIAAADPNRAT